MSKHATFIFEVGGQNVDFPLSAFDIKITSTFIEDNVQPTINIEDIEIAKEYIYLINNHVANGLYYKGLDFKIKVSSDLGVITSFDGYINLPKLYDILNDGTAKVGVIKKNGLDNLQDRLESITWTMLESQGSISDSDFTDVDYVVEKTNNALEIIMLIIVAYVMTTEFIRNIEATIDLTNKITGAAIPSSGIGIVIMVGQILYAALSVVLQALFIAMLLAEIIDKSKRLFDMILSPKRTHKALKYKKGLQILANRLNLVFVSNIPELDNYYYLPSNTQVDDIDSGIGTISNPKGTKKGYPNESDFGFTGLEFVQLCLAQFEAQLVIENGQLIMMAKKDPLWRKNSTYIMPDVELSSKSYNADELVFSRLIRYETDPIADEYTLLNFKGTNYQILTKDNSVIMGADDNFINKHETISFNIALGTRKDKLNAAEKILKSTGKVIDNLTGIFGGGTNYASKVKNRIGVLKVGTNNHTKAKCLYLIGGKMPENHRDFTSAKYLYDKYIDYRSFVANNFDRQRAKYTIENMPFGMENFMQISQNSWAKDSGGNDVKVTFNDWEVLNDKSITTIEKKEIFAPNLYEVFIEEN